MKAICAVLDLDTYGKEKEPISSASSAPRTGRGLLGLPASRLSGEWERGSPQRRGRLGAATLSAHQKTPSVLGHLWTDSMDLAQAGDEAVVVAGCYERR